MARSDLVTRTIVREVVYNVYKRDQRTLVQIGTVAIKGKPSAVAIAKQFGEPSVIIEPKHTIYDTYGVSVDEFMKLATLVKTDKK